MTNDVKVKIKVSRTFPREREKEDKIICISKNARFVTHNMGYEFRKVVKSLMEKSEKWSIFLAVITLLATKEIFSAGVDLIFLKIPFACH